MTDHTDFWLNLILVRMNGNHDNVRLLGPFLFVYGKLKIFPLFVSKPIIICEGHFHEINAVSLGDVYVFSYNKRSWA